MTPTQILQEATAIRKEMQEMVIKEFKTTGDSVINVDWYFLNNQQDPFSIDVVAKYKINGVQGEFRDTMERAPGQRGDIDQESAKKMLNNFLKHILLQGEIASSLLAAIKGVRLS
jgi:hypothetical protein